MRCSECGVEMMIYTVTVTPEGEREPEWVCRNPRCVQFDRRLKKAPEEDDNTGQ